MFNSTESPRSQAERSARSRFAFGDESPNLDALDSALSELEAVEQLSRGVDAARIAALAKIDHIGRREAARELGVKARERAAEDSIGYRSARADAATALHLSEQATAGHLAQAATLTAAYPATIAVLESREISKRHAAVILDAGRVIGPVKLPGDTDNCSGVDVEVLAEVAANRAVYEALVLAEAVKTTPNRLAPIARSLAERFACEDLDARHERARTARRLWLTPRDEGMVEIGALLPAHEGTAVVSRLTEMAKRAEHVQDREEREARESGAAAEASEAGLSGLVVPVAPRRNLSEIKADLFVDLLLNGTGDTATGGPGCGTGIFGIVQLVSHATHFSSNTTGDAATTRQVPLPELEGYGPIPVNMAREIAAQDGEWAKVNVNLRTGEVLTVDTYRPSAQIRRFLTARDQRCRFPGCRVQIHRCDFDHTIDAALGGPTSTLNLGGLCRGHHILKHHSAWSPKQYPNGDYEWTSPTGRIHIDEPVSRVRFMAIPEAAIVPELEPELELELELPPDSRAEGTTLPETEHQGKTPSETWDPEDVHPF